MGRPARMREDGLSPSYEVLRWIARTDVNGPLNRSPVASSTKSNPVAGTRSSLPPPRSSTGSRELSISEIGAVLSRPEVLVGVEIERGVGDSVPAIGEKDGCDGIDIDVEAHAADRCTTAGICPRPPNRGSSSAIPSARILDRRGHAGHDRRGAGKAR